MVKIVIMSKFATALVMFTMRLLPKLRLFSQRLLQNPFVRANRIQRFVAVNQASVIQEIGV